MRFNSPLFWPEEQEIEIGLMPWGVLYQIRSIRTIEISKMMAKVVLPKKRIGKLICVSGYTPSTIGAIYP